MVISLAYITVQVLDSPFQKKKQLSIMLEHIIPTTPLQFTIKALLKQDMFKASLIKQSGALLFNTGNHNFPCKSIP